MKKLFLLALLLTCCSLTNAQVVIGSRYRGMSFEEMAAPLRKAQAVYEKAQGQIEEYIVKSLEARDKQSWRLEKYYLEKALQKNAEFNNRIIGNEDRKNIKSRISWLDNALKQQDSENKGTPVTKNKQ